MCCIKESVTDTLNFTSRFLKKLKHLFQRDLKLVWKNVWDTKAVVWQILRVNLISVHLDVTVKVRHHT